MYNSFKRGIHFPLLGTRCSELFALPIKLNTSCSGNESKVDTPFSFISKNLNQQRNRMSKIRLICLPVMLLLLTACTTNDGGHQGGSHADNQCPSDLKGNECEYYKDGYKAGAKDGKASMSNFYGRHEDGYDSRFEPYFKRGYQAGWQDYR